MPNIPVFENTLSAPVVRMPEADPQAFAAPGQALARGGAQVAGIAEQWAEQYADARRTTDASNIVASTQKQAISLADQARIIPDRTKALGQFDDGYEQLKQQALANTQDPLVKAHVTQQVDQLGSILHAQIAKESFDRESSAHTAERDKAELDYRNQMAANRDPLFRAHTQDAVIASENGAAAVGWQTQDQAQQRIQGFLGKVAQDDTMRDWATDPVGTYARLSDPGARAKAYPYLDPNWADWFAMRHEGQAKTAQARTVVDDVFPLPQAVPEQMRDLVDRAVIGTPVPSRLVAAVAQHESAWDPNLIGSAGEIGLGQVKPSTAQEPGYGVAPVDPATLRDPAANLRFAAQYLAGLGRAHGVTDWSDPAQVGPVLQDYNGSSRKAQYADAVLHLAGMHGGDVTYPDTEALAARVAERTAGDDALQERALAELSHRISIYRTNTAADRSALERTLADTRAALDQGLDVPVPVDRIQALMPKEQAQDLVQDLAARSAIGQIVRSVQWQTPDEVAATVKSLEEGTGSAATMLNLRLAKAGFPMPAVADSADPTSANFRVRTAAVGMLRTLLGARQETLTHDPATYVANEPTVAALYAAIDPQKPETFEAYAARSKDVQAHLGVPEQNQRVMSTAQSQALASKLTSADATTTDVGGQLDILAKSYGRAWPDVWHDLVRDGKMPPDWQVLGQMQPGPDRIAMQRALQASTAKGGTEELRKSVSQSDAQDIDKGLNDALEDFRRSVFIPGLSGDDAVYTGVSNATRTLAYWNVLNGQKSGQALQNAVNAVLPYDFEGLARAPKGQGALASNVASRIQASITGDSLAPAAGGLKGQDNQDVQDVAARALRSGGQWVTNNRGDGWVLAIRDRTGAWQFPLDSRGRQIGFKFDRMPGMTSGLDMVSPTELPPGAAIRAGMAPSPATTQPRVND